MLPVGIVGVEILGNGVRLTGCCHASTPLRLGSDHFAVGELGKMWPEYRTVACSDRVERYVDEAFSPVLSRVSEIPWSTKGENEGRGQRHSYTKTLYVHEGEAAR